MKNYSQFSITCSGKEKHSTQINTKEPKKKNQLHFAFHSGDVISYGYILYFVNINSIKLPFAVVERLVPVRVRVETFHPVTSVLSVAKLEQLEVIHVNNIIEKCVCMHLQNSTYPATFPTFKCLLILYILTLYIQSKLSRVVMNTYLA